MGGVFGIIGRTGRGQQELMIRLLGHRGREASVEPLPAGFIGSLHQPGQSSLASSGGSTLAGDVTLYNSASLRRELAVHGIEVPHAGPSMVLLATLRAFGLSAIDRIDGDFAFVLLDRASRCVTLARDQVGSRPLYWVRRNAGGLAFASEYKALVSLQERPASPDRNVVQFLQCAKRLPPGRTLLPGIHEVTPGTAVRLDLSGRELGVHRVPSLHVQVTVTKEADAVQLIRSSLVSAVERRTRDLERIGLALSGGIDSIALAFLCRRLHPDRELHAFTAGYGPDDPEVRTAAAVAARLEIRHHLIQCLPAQLDRRSLESLVWALEDPIARAETFQLLQVAQAASDHVGVVLSGQAANSLFAGMPKYLVVHAMRRLPWLRPGLTDLYDLTQLSLRPRTAMGKLLCWLYQRGRVPPAPVVLGARMPARIRFCVESRQWVNEVTLAGFRSGATLALRKFELTFARHGIEHRAPYCDPELVQTAFGIADDLKLKHGHNKYILRKALETIVDPIFLKVSKRPQRMRYDLAFGRVDQIAGELLASDAVRRRGLFEPGSVRVLFSRGPNRP